MSTINTMEELIQVLDEHPEWVEALRSRLLTRELLDLPHNFAMFVAEMREFKTQMDRFVAATNKRFDAVDARFDTVDARFDAVDARFDTVDARFDAVDARFDTVDARFDAVDARFEAVDARFDAVDSRFEAIDARFDAVDSRLDGHDVMFRRITDDLGQLKGVHARNVALADAPIIARDLKLRRTKNLTQEELLDLIDAADTSGIHVGDLRSFRVADLIMEARAVDGTTCYVAVKTSYTANERDSRRATRNAKFMTRFTGKRAIAVVSGLYRDDRIQDSIESGEVFWHQLTPEQLEAE